jgi:pectinesterase
MLPPLGLFLSLASAAAASPFSTQAARPSPPPGCLAVGSSSQYRTVQSAVNALSTTTSTAQCIFIYPGTYREQVYVPPLTSPLTIYGSTTNPLTASANTVTLTQSRSQDDSPNNDATATLRAHTANLRVYNLHLVNTRGKGSQAVALSAQRDRQAYYGCQFRGYQDTVLANEGAQLYARSTIVGATDFIFGQRARAWFDGVDIRVLGAGVSVGYVTANGRDKEENPSWYVIHRSTVAAVEGEQVKDGAYYLGRPWRNYARVVFQRTRMEKVVNKAGWRIWNEGDERTDKVLFGEFGNDGEGAKGQRASFATKLTEEVAIGTVLGGDYKSWVDTAYLS